MRGQIKQTGRSCIWNPRPCLYTDWAVNYHIFMSIDIWDSLHWIVWLQASELWSWMVTESWGTLSLHLTVGLKGSMWLCQALRKIIWPKREEGNNKRLMKITYLGALWFVLLTRYYLGDQVADEMGGGKRKWIQDFDGEIWSKETFGWCRHRWESNIKTDLKEIGWRAWTGLIWLGT